MSGGLGTRLRPYTTVIPKALVPLGDMPVLELVLRQLKNYGFTEVTIAVGHLAQLIQAFFGDGEKLGIHISYNLEDRPLGTAGALRAFADKLPDNFIVMNADVVNDVNYRQLFDDHVKSGADATISVYPRTSKIDFGIIEFDPKTHKIEGFTEKPTLEHTVSMGVYVLNKRALDLIPENEFFGYDQLVKGLIKDKRPARVYPHKGYWLDIGRPDDYEQAVNDFQNMREHLLAEGK